MYIHSASQSLQKLVAISIGYWQTLLTLKQVVYRIVMSTLSKVLIAKVKDTVANDY